jgi:hypothetical protein
MNYKLSHIISIGDEIKVLLADDMEYSINHEAFAEWIAPTGEVRYGVPNLQGNTEDYYYMPYTDYDIQVSDLEQYIMERPTVQREIDAKRRFATILDVIKDLEPAIMGRITSAVLDYGKAMAEYGMEVNR